MSSESSVASRSLFASSRPSSPLPVDLQFEACLHLTQSTRRMCLGALGSIVCDSKGEHKRRANRGAARKKIFSNLEQSTPLNSEQLSPFLTLYLESLS